ncbi:hypothetical protein DZJ_07170 [Dickeya ananatis]
MFFTQWADARCRLNIIHGRHVRHDGVLLHAMGIMLNIYGCHHIYGYHRCRDEWDIATVAGDSQLSVQQEPA